MFSRLLGKSKSKLDSPGLGNRSTTTDISSNENQAIFSSRGNSLNHIDLEASDVVDLNI